MFSAINGVCISSAFLYKSLACGLISKVACSSFPKGSKLLDFHRIEEAKGTQRFNDAILDYIKNSKDLSGIKNFKQDVLKQNLSPLANEQTFDALFMRICLADRNYLMGKMYMKHLEENNQKPNTATLTKFLQLCYYCKNDVEDKTEVEKLCETLKSHSRYLDSQSKEALIVGYSITSKWREGFQLICDDKATQASIPMNAVAESLLNNNEFDSAVLVMEMLNRSKKNISDFVYSKWIKKCAEDPSVWSSFSNYLSRNDVFLKELILQQLINVLENRSVDPYKSRKTTIDTVTGRCRCCGEILQSCSITLENYNALKATMLDKVLIAKDVFIGSDPEELNRFKLLIKKTAPYDVVIDGLNVCYMNGDNPKSNPFKRRIELLSLVVNYFYKQKKKILILGRNHMEFWYPGLFNDIKRKAIYFSTKNLSRDDPFLLYAAIQSCETKFVSDDLFRDHLFRLRSHDVDLGIYFRQWQHSAQLQISRINVERGLIDIQYPLKHRTITQCINGNWHIPYDDGSPRHSYQLPKSWLCLQSKT